MANPRALVVDDSASMRALVGSILDDEEFAVAAFGGPFEVVEASSGFDAMRLLPRGPYDVIITDINMGDLTGLELIAFIRKSERYKGTPRNSSSTQNTARAGARGMSLGANAFVSKPFTREALQRAVVTHVAHDRR